MHTFQQQSVAPKQLTLLIALIVTAFITACNPKSDLVAPQAQANEVADLNASAQAEFINAAADSSSTLKSAATFPIGISLDAQLISSNPKVRGIVTNEFNSRTVKLFMNIQTAKGQFNFAEMDARVNATKNQSMRLHGHCLVYHMAAPAWLISVDGNNAGFEAAVKNHIQTIVGRYKGKVHSWDVINEIIDTQTGKMAQTAFRKKYTSDEAYLGFVKRCFQWAHEADPAAILLYNDYGYETSPAKLQAVLRMVADFKKSGTPLNGLGTQTHVSLNTPEAGIRNALQQLAATGLQIHVSELDVTVNTKNDSNFKFSREVEIAQQIKYQGIARLYEQNVPARLQYGITLWDLSDADSWLVVYQKKLDMPAIFDLNYDKKAAFFGLLQGLKN